MAAFPTAFPNKFVSIRCFFLGGGSLRNHLGDQLGCAQTRPFGELVLLTADFRKK